MTRHLNSPTVFMSLRVVAVVSQPLVRMRSATELPTTTITHWARKGREDSKPFWNIIIAKEHTWPIL